MISSNIKDILLKYSKDNQNDIKNINNSLNQIIHAVKNINNNIASNVQKTMTNYDTNESADELLKSSSELKKYITELNNSKIQLNQNNGFQEYNKYTTIYVIPDNLCPTCNIDVIDRFIHYDTQSSSESIKLHICPTCGKLYIYYNELELIDTSNTNIKLNYQHCTPIKMSDTVYVVSSINSCSTNNHNIYDINCMIPVIDLNGKISIECLNISECKTCNKYYMMDIEYDRLLTKGIPCIEIVDNRKDKPENNSPDNINPQDECGTKLTQMGYSVNCNKKLPDAQRQAILEFALEYKSISKGEIISSLKSNIDKGKTRIQNNCKKDWSEAVTKWERDMKFVESLDPGTDKYIVASKFILQYFR